MPLPLAISEVLVRWSQSPRVAGGIVTVRHLPGRAADRVPFPAELHPRLAVKLAAGGIDRLYRHQADALAALRAGDDVVVATPTASGKSLCYHLPVLDAILRDPSATALYLMPTKALARDQLEGLRGLVRALEGAAIGAAVFDGDTPADHRRKARQARVVATNPDMLHQGILPHHASLGCVPRRACAYSSVDENPNLAAAWFGARRSPKVACGGLPPESGAFSRGPHPSSSIGPPWAELLPNPGGKTHRAPHSFGIGIPGPALIGW